MSDRGISNTDLEMANDTDFNSESDEVYKDPTWTFGPLPEPPTASSALVPIGNQEDSTMTLEEENFSLKQENLGYKIAFTQLAATQLFNDTKDPVVRANLLNTVAVLQPYTPEHLAQKTLQAAETAEAERKLAAINDEYAIKKAEVEELQAKLNVMHLQVQSIGNNFERGSQNITNIHHHANTTVIQGYEHPKFADLPSRPRRSKVSAPPSRPKVSIPSSHPKVDRYVKKPKFRDDCKNGKHCQKKRTCACTHPEQCSFWGAPVIDSLPKWGEVKDV